MKNKLSIIFALMAFVVAINFMFGFTKNKVLAEEFNMNFSSKAVYMMDENTHTVICKKDETKRLPIASMCKIMTLLLCFKSIDEGNLSLNEKITVSENASSMGGSQVFLEANGEYLVSDLIKSIVVASANDSCVALAEKIAGSEDSFVEKMNQTASELNMENTRFSNCTGLPKPEQFSCAKDVATMFSELIKHKEYFEFSTVWMDKIYHPNDRFTEISNTNKLIRFYNGCDAGKTGYTSEAGHCLTASANKNGLRLISVVIGAPDSKTRFSEVSSMFNYGFANYVNKTIVDNNSPLNLKVDIKGGKKDSIEVIAEKCVNIFSQKNEKRSFEINFVPLEKIKAPVNKGEVVGKLEIYENNILINSVNVLANESVNQKTYFDYIKDINLNWALV